MAAKKNEVYPLRIEGYGSAGEGVARLSFITNYSLSSLSFSNSLFCNVKITSLLTLALLLNMLSISEGCSRVISQNPFCRFAPPNDSLKSRSLL